MYHVPGIIYEYQAYLVPGMYVHDLCHLMVVCINTAMDTAGGLSRTGADGASWWLLPAAAACLIVGVYYFLFIEGM